MMSKINFSVKMFHCFLKNKEIPRWPEGPTDCGRALVFQEMKLSSVPGATVYNLYNLCCFPLKKSRSDVHGSLQEILQAYTELKLFFEIPVT